MATATIRWLTTYAGTWRCRKREDIIPLGLEKLSASDRRVVQRVRRLQRYLTQPFHAMTSQNAAQGVSVPLAQAPTDCEAILGGE